MALQFWHAWQLWKGSCGNACSYGNAAVILQLCRGGNSMNVLAWQLWQGSYGKAAVAIQLWQGMADMDSLW